ncbi:hypothetical protein P885DRAFT_42431 [Corynascus similis CBS 632.67]
MAPPIELSSTVGVKSTSIDYGSFRKWLKPIWVRATVHPDLSREPNEVGAAFGFIIRRSRIRQTFHESMEVPHRATSDLALALFDRYGRLREDIRQHPVRQGSGIWKGELDDGNIVLVEDVCVDEDYRRQGIGAKLVLHLLQTAMTSEPSVRYAFTLPEAYFDNNVEDDKGKQTEQEKRDTHRSKVVGVVRFFRSLQFRRVGLTGWFALARDEQHMSRQLPSDRDVDPIPDDPSDSDDDSDPDLILVLEDSDALKLLQEFTKDDAAHELDVEATDGRGDTVMHVAAKSRKPICLSWIWNRQNGTSLSSRRNHEGYTPLEALEARLEDQRVQEPFGWSRRKFIADKFDGYDDNSVLCLLILQGHETPTAEQREKARFGCTCGNCLAGFLSPRMLKNLRAQADVTHDYLLSLVPPGRSDWYEEFRDMLVYLPDTIRSQLRHKKVLQTAFVELVGAVAKCLADNSIPRKENVTKYLQESHIRPQIEKYYFSSGGTVAAVVNVIIDRARDQDIEVGESLLEMDAEEWFEGVVKCRNDQEYEFVRRHCTDDAPPKEEHAE